MRNRDGADAAACIYLGYCFVVQQRDAIPEQVSSGRLEKQSPLADCKFRFCADAQKLWHLIFEAIVMIRRHPFERRPFLAVVTDELPFVFANWTVRRRFHSLTELRPALHADKVFHDKIARRGLLQRTLRNTSSPGTEMISDVTLPPASFTKRNVRSESS